MVRPGRALSLFLVLFSLLPLAVRGSSVDEAWALYLAGDRDGAIGKLSTLPTDEGERAAAFDLLGSIAFERGSCEGARAHWEAAAALGGRAGHEAALKLVLLRAAAGCPPAGTAPETSADVAEAVAERPPAGTIPVPPVAAPPAAGTAGAEAGARPDLVLVAGLGTPFDAVREAVARVTEFLRGLGVEAESPTAGIAVVEESQVVLGQLLTAARDREAAGVLLLDARFGHRERVEATCYDPQGAVLLSEQVTGGMGLVRPVRMNENLMERIEEKLTPLIGGPCLPVTR